MNSKELEKAIEIFEKKLRQMKSSGKSIMEIEQYKSAKDSLRKVWVTTLISDGIKTIVAKKGPGTNWEVLDKNNKKRDF